MGRLDDDVCRGDAERLLHAAAHAAGVLATQTGQIRRDDDHGMSVGAADREGAGPQRVVDPRGQAVVRPQGDKGAESREMDPAKAVAELVELGGAGVGRGVLA